MVVQMSGGYEQGGVSFTEADHDAQSTVSAVTGDFEEDTETKRTDKEVVAVVTVSSLENPATSSSRRSLLIRRHRLLQLTWYPQQHQSEDVSNVEQELTEDVSFTTTERAIQATTASVESETIKVITTVTRNEIIRPVGADDLSEATLVDTTRTTSVETLPVSKLNDTIKTARKQSDVSVSSDNPSVVEVASVDTTQTTSVEAVPLSEVEDEVTSSEESEVSETPTDDEEKLQPEEAAAEVSTFAVADEAFESTTAAAAATESATVKVITTVTHKEIVRPVDSHDSQSDTTVVDTSKTTSVETLAVSEVDKLSTSKAQDSAAAESTTVSEEVFKTMQDAAEHLLPKEPTKAPTINEEATDSP
ncbi:hypothetical protein MRX96_047720 [Rhipicephalus microplus]